MHLAKTVRETILKLPDGEMDSATRYFKRLRARFLRLRTLIELDLLNVNLADETALRRLWSKYNAGNAGGPGAYLLLLAIVEERLQTVQRV